MSSSAGFEPIKTRGLLIEFIATSARIGAWAMLHDERKVAYLGRGLSWVEGLARNLRQLEDGEHACKELQEMWVQKPGTGHPSREWELVCAEEQPPNGSEKSYLKLYLWCQEKGYRVMSGPPIQWRPVLEIMEDRRPNGANVHKTGAYLAVVWNKTASGRKVMGRAFHTVDEAREWSKKEFGEQGFSWQARISRDDLTNELAAVYSEVR